MAVDRALGIPYCASAQEDPFRQFDAYAVQGSGPRPLLIFVHGGAWRSEDKADHAQLAQQLALATLCPVFVPNYRLTAKTIPGLRHPAHAEDILQFLEFILGWKPSEHPKIASAMDAQQIYLVGHSCSAHMLASILLDSDAVTPSLAPTAQLLEAVKGVILSEGIYDLDLLLKTFPKYGAWFINEAFGTAQSYSEYDINHYQLRPLDNRTAYWLIIHSTGDDLIDTDQSKTMYAHLCNLYGQTRITAVLDRLVDGHDDILKGDAKDYIDIIQAFLKQVQGQDGGGL
ncbi:Alpha/Beta hydrolase protein [Coprinopsis sp. MPI-PUGE-AT-0042]|nr:Alpha/Beta hydrolase protein [Coprinopsis sp. MPI-PUGE-AT-0042]